MMKMDSTRDYTLFNPAEAEAKAAELQAEDEDWTYKVNHDPAGTGKSFIEVLDEDGQVVGRI